MSEEVEARIGAVKAMYAHKTKALLSNIGSLEEEVRILKLASKEHNRSKLIGALQQVRRGAVSSRASAGNSRGSGSS